LLLLSQITKNGKLHHFVGTRKLPNLLRINRSYDDGCRSCLAPVKQNRKSHFCNSIGQFQSIRSPKNKYYEFRKFNMKLPIAYLIFFKISTYFKPREPVQDSSKKLKYTRVRGNLEAACFSIVVIGPDRNVKDVFYYDDEYCMEKFPICLKPFDLTGLKCYHHSHTIPHDEITTHNFFMANKVICTLCNLKMQEKPYVAITHELSK